MTQTAAQTQTEGIGYEEAVAEFLEYLRHYRGYAASTAVAYGTDLRRFREFLEDRLGHVPSPTQIRREHIIQSGVSLKGAAPLTLRRKYACLSSLFGFLQDRSSTAPDCRVKASRLTSRDTPSPPTSFGTALM